jgi:DNA-binding beta-propeller fold protein YncE
MPKNLHMWTLAMLTMVGLAISCASTKHETMPAYHPVWPSAPDDPRVIFVKTISGPADIGQSPSFFRRIGNWLTGDNGSSKNLQKPFGIALDENGNLCVTDTQNNYVCYLDFAKRKWLRWNAVGKLHFKSPVAIARKNGIFYVADSELDEVIAFNGNGKLLFQISTPLKRPVGLTIAGDSLVVVDSQLHSVFVFDLQGKLKFQFGKRGIGPGEFNFPTHVSADNFGHLLVTDSMNNRVQVFSADGKFVSEIGSGGDTSGHFARPKGAAADSFDHVYVADAVFSNIQIFDLHGQLLLNLGEAGTRAGQFGLPNGIAIGADNQIYIADCYNHRVQVLKYIGQE